MLCCVRGIEIPCKGGQNAEFIALLVDLKKGQKRLRQGQEKKMKNRMEQEYEETKNRMEQGQKGTKNKMEQATRNEESNTRCGKND
ncbi:hypothetical protein AVEN_9895-1 [Araneus ventricosus]|uniref:Uncharacterized protein n=1 Tax=Araneus ventricosus TaxID=182803 RepID=A0A4Y2RLN6_ARAVE|nr:hypothetical protein AVEN_9895-1 [Araneus ventricosus]